MRCSRRLAGAALHVLLMSAWPTGANAETATASAPGATAPLQAVARLDFTVNIGMFLFFGVGGAAYPVASTTIDTVSFDLTPTALAGPPPPLDGNDAALSWDATVPAMAVVPVNAAVPVEVHSNAGTISLRASIDMALACGPNSIPFSQISVGSSDPTLPAPPIPDSGTGPSANVAGSAFGNQVTIRAAQWTFGYSPATPTVAGTYSGRVRFTASTP